MRRFLLALVAALTLGSLGPTAPQTSASTVRPLQPEQRTALRRVLWPEIYAQQTGGGGITGGGRVFNGGTVTSPIKFPDGSATAPSLTFVNNTALGFYKAGANAIGVATNNGSAESHEFGTNYFQINSLTAQLFFSGDTILARDAANALALKNGSNVQSLRIYGDATNYTRITNSASSGTIEAGQMFVNGTAGSVIFQTNSTNRWVVLTTTGHLTAAVDNTYDIGASGATRPRNIYRANITPAASVAAGGTVNTDSDITRARYQVTVAPAAGDCSTAFIAAALTADCTIATLPAGQKLVGIYADVTAGFTCSGTCSGTKVMQAGTAAGGTQILAAGLNVAVTGTFGLADADLGSGMTRAASIQGGLIGSWSATTPVSVRFTSGTGNWGSGAATFVNAGSVKFTLITEQVK